MTQTPRASRAPSHFMGSSPPLWGKVSVPSLLPAQALREGFWGAPSKLDAFSTPWPPWALSKTRGHVRQAPLLADFPTSAEWRRAGGWGLPLLPGGPSLRKVQSAAANLPKRGSGSPAVPSKMQPPPRPRTLF